MQKIKVHKKQSVQIFEIVVYDKTYKKKQNAELVKNF